MSEKNFGVRVVEDTLVKILYVRKVENIYTLEPGDKWCWIGDKIGITNAEKIPFTIDLVTGERKNIEMEDGRVEPKGGGTA